MNPALSIDAFNRAAAGQHADDLRAKTAGVIQSTLTHRQRFWPGRPSRVPMIRHGLASLNTSIEARAQGGAKLNCLYFAVRHGSKWNLAEPRPGQARAEKWPQSRKKGCISVPVLSIIG
jgi:hypothetical protein